MRLLEHGLTILREGCQQLRHLGIGVVNPLVDEPELGRQMDFEAFDRPLVVAEKHNVHGGARNSAKAGRPSRRPRPRLSR